MRLVRADCSTNTGRQQAKVAPHPAMGHSYGGSATHHPVLVSTCPRRGRPGHGRAGTPSLQGGYRTTGAVAVPDRSGGQGLQAAIGNRTFRAFGWPSACADGPHSPHLRAPYHGPRTLARSGLGRAKLRGAGGVPRWGRCFARSPSPGLPGSLPWRTAQGAGEAAGGGLRPHRWTLG